MLPVQVIVDISVGGSSLSQDFPKLKRGKNGSNLSKEGNGHQNGVHHEQAAVLQTRDGNAKKANDENVESEYDYVDWHHQECWIPEVELFNLKSFCSIRIFFLQFRLINYECSSECSLHHR